MTRLAILGCTGSIGTQTLDVVRRYPERFEVVGLATSGSSPRSLDILAEQIAAVRPSEVVLATLDAAERARSLIAGLPQPPTVQDGQEALVRLASHPDVDLVVVATSGQHGFAPTLAALAAGKQVALANKEVLVMAGELVTAAARAAGIELRPIDSEHSAIWQALRGESSDGGWSATNPAIRRLLVTASGGPFRTLSRDQMQDVSVEQALKHPNWAMGAKITIDSATLMNKGLEVIEAHWLFGLDYDKIDVVVHPQSVIHSMVEFVDSTIKAQIGTPDMRIPILYALAYPDRLAIDLPRVDWTQLTALNFETPDPERFPALRLAYECGRRGGTYPTVLAAADEEAVKLFLDRRINFLGIAQTVEQVVERHTSVDHPDLAAIAAADAWARQEVAQRTS